LYDINLPKNGIFLLDGSEKCGKTKIICKILESFINISAKEK
jgi:hypothetical protein